MKLIYPLILAACMTGCSEAREPSHTSRVEWTPVPYSRVRELCGPDLEGSVSGCVKKYEKVCRIITEPMPMGEYTSSSYMTSPQWKTLAHELMHCFGYEHT